MQPIQGIAVSPGIVIGRLRILEDDLRRVARREVQSQSTRGEVEHFDQAVKASIGELEEVADRAEREMGKEAAKIFSFHIGMLKDKSLLAPIRTMIQDERVSADWAVSQVFQQHAAKFRSNPNPVFATKVNDIEDIGRRLLRKIANDNEPAGRVSRLKDEDGGVIIVARDLTPSETAAFDRDKILGFATDLGGKTSHTAIVAKALEIPAVVGCQRITKLAHHDALAILDGDDGVVVLDPDEKTLAEYRKRIDARREYQVELSDDCFEPSVTADGVAVHVVGNIEFPDEVRNVLASGGEGVGLYRTEFLYLTSTSEPSEHDHYRAYKRCVDLLKGRDLVIRTMDLGADKYTQAREEVPERNPFLGCRSIRYCLHNIPMFKTQLRAILRASAHGPLKIMFPLITSLAELRHAKVILGDVMEDLDEAGVEFDRSMKVGMMVEVPSAALMADHFAREVDFFSIGTNDLVQYTLAVDRTNERVANLYSPTHPAVIRLIRDTARVGKHHKIPVSCCGESASDPEFAMLLIGLGLRTLSVTSSSIPTLKRFVRGVTVAQCERVAKQVMSLDSDAQVAVFLRDKARKIVPQAFDGRSVE
ncbi:MAG: phosphoenolpyruvate--protein phosphotransferase [Phycisphaerales bacterium]|nr:MAG: phosphoenolpyruvate--protein phosphotransferase [Phycisphaerales bacterium]